jgi:hypothetical protein
MEQWLMKIFKPAFLYFLLVFGTGFVLGIIRTIWVAPRFGARTAELMEMPIMLIVILIAARWIVQRFVQPVPSRWLAIGFLALAFALAMEFSFVLSLQGITISEYFAKRDPVSGTAYSLSLILFACAPLLVALKFPPKTNLST